MPIVETPQDALYCLQITGLDYCVLGDLIVKKREKVLLGLDLTPDEPKEEGRRREKPVIYRDFHTVKEVASLASHSLKDYVGTYGQEPNSITIEEDGSRLKAKLLGMSTTLEPDGEDSFVVTGSVFANYKVTFYCNEDGDVVSLRVFMPAVDGKVNDILFERFDVRTMTEDEFSRVAGTYECRGETFVVSVRRGKTLTLTAPDRRKYVMLLDYDSFVLKNTPGYRIKFNVDGPGGSVTAILTQPNGRFVLRKNG